MDLNVDEMTQVQNAACLGDPCPIKGAEDIYNRLKVEAQNAPEGSYNYPQNEWVGGQYDELIDDFFASVDSGELDDDSPDDTKAGDNTPKTEEPPVENGQTNG